jgi:rhamnogalacturonyl hydrolase YesR
LDITDSLRSLEKYVEKEEFKGYDCYDALNSPILSALSLRNKPLRMAFIQALKMSPINARPLFLIRKGFNPKGIGLFLSAVSRLFRVTGDKNYLNKLEFFTNLLIESSSKGYSGNCWGYNFDWQSRVFFVPKFTPTIVNTVYVGHGFLDAYEAKGDPKYLQIARSACDFILNDLNRTEEEGSLCFSYTPIDHLRVHNANILGASLLARVFAQTHELHLKETARQSAEYVMRRQNPDGSWHYAETAIQKWVDSFHTGFVLESLQHYIDGTGDRSYETNLKKGFDFFVDHFFLEDGTPKYFHNETYPIDIHSGAQAIVTLTKLRHLNDQAGITLEKLLAWVLGHMQDSRGFFYFQKRKWFTNRISYMRWSQAWMYHALAQYTYDKKFNHGLGAI